MSSVSRITVLISGNGTNLQALIDAINDGKLSATIIRVVSNRKAARGLDRARESGIPTTYHNLLKYKNQHPKTNEGVQVAREKYDQDLAQQVLEDKPDLVACLGFMHVVSQKFLDPLNEARVKIINLHPALPGRFNGTNALERAHTAWREGKIDKTGVMIHEVIAEVDMGAPILVREIFFEDGKDDNLEDFEKKVHGIEWGAVVEGVGIAISATK